MSIQSLDERLPQIVVVANVEGASSIACVSKRRIT